MADGQREMVSVRRDKERRDREMYLWGFLAKYYGTSGIDLDDFRCRQRRRRGHLGADCRYWSLVKAGGGAADYSLFRRMFQSRQLAFVRAPLPFPTKNETKAVPKGNKGVGRVGEMSGRMGRPLSSVDTARLSEVKYKSESPVG